MNFQEQAEQELKNLEKEEAEIKANLKTIMAKKKSIINLLKDYRAVPRKKKLPKNLSTETMPPAGSPAPE